MRAFQVAINRAGSGGSGIHTHYYVILHQDCNKAETLALNRLGKDFPGDRLDVQFCKTLKPKKHFPLLSSLISE